MTTSSRTTLQQLLEPATHILLDFDGPIADVFAGRPAAKIADKLREIVASGGGPLSQEARPTPDPFAVLLAAEPRLIGRLEQALREAELEAADLAAATPGAEAVIRAAVAGGRRVAVVSNNSAPAVAAYMARMGLDGLVTTIVGRDREDPARMKPSPFLLVRALSVMDAAPERSVFVGDSTTDMLAARRAGIPAIGYANKPGKHKRLADAGAAVVIDDMRELVRALDASAARQAPRRS